MAPIVLGLLLLSAALPAAEPAQRVYKWVDNKGVTHYGDSVPPEYAQGERSILNNQGVEVGHVAGRKSSSEQQAQDQADQRTRTSTQHDQFLLTSYTSTHDIEILRDERLDQMDGQIKASAAYVESLRGRLAELVQRAQQFTPYSDDAKAHRMPDQLAADLIHAANEARIQRAALAAKQQEQLDMRTQFERDIERFKELTAQSRSAP